MNPKDLLAKYWKENKIAPKEVIKAFLFSAKNTAWSERMKTRS